MAAADDADEAVAVTGVPGAALCDLRRDIEQTLQDEPPAALVLVFAGNNLTACAGGRTGAELVDLYGSDATAIVELAADGGRAGRARGAAGDRTVAVGRERGDAERSVPRDRRPSTTASTTSTSARCSRPRASRRTLPCLGSEGAEQGCVDGDIVVRDEDGVHFDDPGPDGYSSGSYRFAQAVFAAGEDAA